MTDNGGATSSDSVVVTVETDVTITSAQYRSKPRMLEINAISTDPTAILTAFDADTNVELGVLVGGKLSIKITPSPINIRVTSDKGGSDTTVVQVN